MLWIILAFASLAFIAQLFRRAEDHAREVEAYRRMDALDSQTRVYEFDRVSQTRGTGPNGIVIDHDEYDDPDEDENEAP